MRAGEDVTEASGDGVCNDFRSLLVDVLQPGVNLGVPGPVFSREVVGAGACEGAPRGRRNAGCVTAPRQVGLKLFTGLRDREDDQVKAAMSV